MYEQRKRDLIEARRCVIRMMRQRGDVKLTQEAIWEAMTVCEAPRFYVSYDKAYSEVGRLLCRKPLRHTSERSCAMFDCLARLTEAYLRRNRWQSLGVALAWAIDQPAPSFFLSAQSIRKIVGSE